MENGKSKLLIVVLMTMLCLTTGCVITLTKNQYYGDSGQSNGKKQVGAQGDYVSDTIKSKNDRRN